MVWGKGQLMQYPSETIWYYAKTQIMCMPHDPENAHIFYSKMFSFVLVQEVL